MRTLKKITSGAGHLVGRACVALDNAGKWPSRVLMGAVAFIGVAQIDTPPSEKPKDNKSVMQVENVRAAETAISRFEKPFVFSNENQKAYRTTDQENADRVFIRLILDKSIGEAQAARLATSFTQSGMRWSTIPRLSRTDVDGKKEIFPVEMKEINFAFRDECLAETPVYYNASAARNAGNVALCMREKNSEENSSNTMSIIFSIASAAGFGYMGGMAGRGLAAGGANVYRRRTQKRKMN